MGKKDLSVVVPCFNEETGLKELHRRVSLVCQNDLSSDLYEIILINDGSSDNSWHEMLKLSEEDPHVVVVNLSRNHGHQLALTAGLDLCCGERVFILDADLQDPPELLPKMMSRMDEGFDVIYGQRTKREGETTFKKVTAFAFYRILNYMVEVKVPQDTGDFRLMSRRSLDVLKSMPEHHRFIRGMVSWIGLKQEAFPYERAERFLGETKYPVSKMIKFAIDAITGFSVRPLRIASYLGLCFGALTLLFLFYILIHYMIGHTVEGWTSLAVIILALGSAQLFVAGVIGEYLGRLYLQSKGRPLFVIQEIVGKSDVNESSSE